MADHGAHVILACRDEEKARQARDKLESELERSSLELLHLDLADLVSVRRAADEVLSGHARLDIVVNNAGVMGTPYRLTPDGFELQMATNHLGHFAADGTTAGPHRDDRALPHRHRQLAHAPHGAVREGDVAGGAFHNTWVAYGTSKLANLLFTAELSRRLLADGLRTIAVAAHPGWTRSNLAGTGAAMGNSRLRRKLGQDGRLHARAIAGGGCPAGAVRGDLVVRRVGPVHRPGAPGASTAHRGWRDPRDEPGTPGRRPNSGRFPRP